MGENKYYTQSVKLKCWEDALPLARKLSQTPPNTSKLATVNWLFRGQSADWPIASSLQRARVAGYKKEKDKDYGCVDVERRVITHFRENAHLFNPLLAEDVGNFEWAARLQHYGGPTRLVDFSRSFWVAAFFALELGASRAVKRSDKNELEMDSSKAEPVIWAVEGCSLYYAVREKIPKESWDDLLTRSCKNGMPIHDKYHSERMRASRLMCDLSIWGDGSQFKPETWKRELALYVESGKTDERIVAQSGAFICPLNPESCFETCLRKSFGLEKAAAAKLQTYHPGMGELSPPKGPTPVIIKIYLPLDEEKKGCKKTDEGKTGRKKTIRNGLHILEKMNITRATLFSGMDGLARSLFTHLTR